MKRNRKNKLPFEVDLFGGKGVPERVKPADVAVFAMIFAVPVIIALVMLGYHLQTKIILSIQRQEIVNYDAKINKLSDAAELYREFVKEKDAINKCMSEVKNSLSRCVQWSPILLTLVENMPDSIVLTDLKIGKRSVRKRIPREDNPEAMIEVSVPVNILQMSVCGLPNTNCDEQVKKFRDLLRLSPLLEPKLENIKVSQKVEMLQDQEVISYEIECIFKSLI